MPIPQKLSNPHTVRTLISAIAHGASDASAARSAGVTTKTLRRHRGRDKAFDTLYRRADAARRGEEPFDVQIPPVPVHPPIPTAAETKALGVAFVDHLVGAAIDCEVVDAVAPDPRRLAALADVYIGEVEQRLPTGKVNPELPWGLGVRELLAKNQRLVDQHDAPSGLRSEALRTLNKLYLGPVLDLLMADLTRGRPAMDDPHVDNGPGHRGLGPDTTADLMDEIAGPAPVEPEDP